MEDIRGTVEQLTNGWADVYEKIKGQPSLYQAHLPHSNPEQLAEVVGTVSDWFGRIRAPKGYAPTFHIARELLGTSFTSVLASLKALQQAQYAHLPTFVSGLNQILSALHTMMVFSEKNDTQMAIGDMSAQLSEALSLLRTGQGELKAKADILDQATSSAENLESAWETVQKLQSNIATSAEEVLAFTEDVRTQKATADELVADINGLKSDFEKVLSENNVHTQHLADQLEQVNELQARNVAQQKLIEELLPKATSAGLAYGFQIRVDELETTKYIWMVAFFASIVLLGVVAFINGPFIPDELKDPWLRLLYRLPMAA